MRKNIFNTVAGLLVAVSMLFAAIGCTNINDPETLKNDSFTVNKMAITGFKVTGLDGNYDHSTVKLMVVKHVLDGEKEKEETEVAASGIIADDKDNLNPGSAYVKLTTPYIFDAGENSPVDFECYLEIEKAGVTLGKVEAVDTEDATKTAPAKLAIVSSPYGTKDADLAKRYVEVVVANGVGTFSFAEDLSASLRFAYTALPEMVWADVLAADEAGTWAKIESKTKVDTEYATYKIIVNNLENDEDGMRYVVAGASIGSTKDTAGDHWNAYADNNADEGLISEVKDGSVEFNFVGKAPSWSTRGTAIKIAAIDDPMKSDPWLCLLAAPATDNSDKNFFIPADKDYTITIDAKAAKAEYKFNAVKERFVKVMNFTVVGTKLKEIKEAGESEYLAFCEAWLPGNEWGAKTPNKVSLNDITLDGDVGSATLSLDKGVDFWAGEPYTFVDMPMQIVFPESDDDFWKNKLMEAGFKVYFDDDWIGKAVNIIYDLDDKVATVESGHFVNVVGYEILNLDDDGVKYYIMSQSPANSGNAQPGNEWSNATTIFGTVADNTLVVDCAAWKVIDEVDVQVKKEGADGIDWGSGVQISTNNLSEMNCGANCVVVVDCVAGTAEFVAK
ncbi:MAG: hypothetical protein J6K22_04895 [Spirochaetaceae bacterium]|nr:hypothetical protein [Spirochaetaceae bacterium]